MQQFMLCKKFVHGMIFILSGVYTGKKTLNVVAIANGCDLKRWENFY
jgi:hypothetical protein